MKAYEMLAIVEFCLDETDKQKWVQEIIFNPKINAVDFLNC